MIIIINHGNTPIYTKRQQAKALTTVADLIHKLQTAIHKYCTRQITVNWKTWITECYNEANALTEQHNSMTKAIFTQLIKTIYCLDNKENKPTPPEPQPSTSGTRKNAEIKEEKQPQYKPKQKKKKKKKNY